MKIVHIANFYGPKSGGIRTTLHELGSGYIARGHEFTYIVPGNGFFCEETLHGKKITVPSIVLPFSGGYRIIRNNRDIKKLLIMLKPNALEVSDRFTLSNVGLWAKKRGIHTVVFSHETLSVLFKSFFKIDFKRFVNWHNERLASRFDNVIATTEFAAREFHEIGTKNLAHVPLGVDLQNFSPYRRNEELRTELLKGADVLLLHCGRMSKEKNPQNSILALKELLAAGVNARLVYVGMGPMFKSLKETAKELPVTFMGYIVDRKMLAEIIASADVSIAPGPIETFCLAALESLASGTPVVASKTSAVGEFLLLGSSEPVGAVAENNPKSFAQAIQTVLAFSAADKAMPIRCQHQAENFPWSSTLMMMLRLHGAGHEASANQKRLRAA
jgi:alpha-1,6-mannosyltransferase